VTIAERIARDLGTPDLVDKLIARPANELTSLLLEVTRRRRRTPTDLLAQYAHGELRQLVDGGSTDWTARLMSNGKERFFVSGIGSELLLRRFR
jgi:hypothetical protein